MYGLCGSRGPSKAEHIEHLKRQRNSLQTDIQNLRGQLNASQASARSLSDQLSEIQVRLTSFLEENRSKTSPSVEKNLEAVFWTYSALAERSATEKRDSERRIDNLKAQLVAKENEMDEQRRKLREEAERELRAKDKELKDLEKKLIIGADYFQPKPDSELTNQFSRLQEIIRTFAEDAKPGAPQHTSRLPFAQNVKQRYQQPIPSNHLSHFLEESLWSILIENVFKTPFSVFGTHGEELVLFWCNFFPDGQLKKEARIVCPQPNSFSERWRALTIGNLAAAVRGKQNGPEARRIKSSYRSNCNKVATALQEEYRKASEVQVEGTIDRITELACDIALTCGVERLRVQLAFPEEGTLISRGGNGRRRDRMEPRNVGSNRGQSTVGVVVSPGLEKNGVGDGNSQTFDGSYWTLFPAHVYTFS